MSMAGQRASGFIDCDRCPQIEDNGPAAQRMTDILDRK
jgi:hypothetical protein